MNAIAKRSPLPGELTPTSYVPPAGLGFDEWEQIGLTLKTMERSVRWWIGDWLAYGERTYGEMYSQAIESTGRSYQDLADMAYVAKAIGFSDRSENLSWSHHKEIAALETQNEQRRWLEKAEKEDWSRRELHEQLRLVKRPNAQDDVSIPKCRKCGKECNWCHISTVGSSTSRRTRKRRK